MNPPRGIPSAWGPVVLWAALIFALSSLSLEGPPRAIPHGDTAVHLAEYAVLGYLLMRALEPSAPGRLAPARLAAAAGIAVLYGATDEFHQRFVPGRTPEFADLAADAAGALAGALLRAMRRAPDTSAEGGTG